MTVGWLGISYLRATLPNTRYYWVLVKATAYLRGSVHYWSLKRTCRSYDWSVLSKVRGHQWNRIYTPWLLQEDARRNAIVI